jgi:hypothetical protein
VVSAAKLPLTTESTTIATTAETQVRMRRGYRIYAMTVPRTRRWE